MDEFELKTPTAIVEQYFDEEAETKQKLEQLLQSYQKSDFDIGEVLWKIKKKGYYAPYATFREFAATLSLRKQKATYLCRIVETMERLEIPRAKYEPVGKSKLREICSLDLSKNWTNPLTGEVTPLSFFITSFVEKGLELSLEDIKTHVRTLKGLTGDAAMICKHIWFTEGFIKQVYDPIVEKTRKILGSAGKDDEGVAVDYSEGKCIEMWAVSFDNDPANDILAGGQSDA
jgi:hypothetical protein